MALPPLNGVGLPRCGPRPPPGFFASDGCTLAPRVAVPRSSNGSAPSLVGGGSSGLCLRTTRRVAAGEVLFEEDAVLVAQLAGKQQRRGTVLPPPLAAASQSAAAYHGSSSNDTVVAFHGDAVLRSGDGAAVRDFVAKAGALWSMVEKQLSDAAAAPQPNLPPELAAVTGTPDARGARVRAFTLQVAAIAAALRSPQAAFASHQLGGASRVTLEDCYASRDDAREAVQHSVLLHKLAASVAPARFTSAAPGVTVADLALLYFLATDNDGARLVPTVDGGPVALAALGSCASFVLMAAGANATLTVVEGGATAEGATASATLRLRCCAGPEGLPEGAPVRLLTTPLVSTEGLEAAVEASAASAKKAAPAATAQDRVRAFVEAARNDPAALERFARAAAAGGSGAPRAA